MELAFEQISKIANDYFIDNKYYPNKINTLNSAIEILKCSPFSLITSSYIDASWVIQKQLEFSCYKFKNFRNILYLFRSIYQNGRVVKTHFHYFRFEKLYLSFQLSLDAFVKNYEQENNHNKVRAKTIKTHCIPRLLLLQEKGITQPSDITHESLKKFCEYGKVKTKKERHILNTCNSDFSIYLAYLSKVENLPNTLYLMLQISKIRKLFFINDLDGESFNIFLKFREKPVNYCDFEIFESKYLSIYKESDYSYSVKESTQSFARSFKLFMNANNLYFSMDLFTLWVNYICKSLLGNTRLTQSRYLLLFNQLFTEHEINFNSKNSNYISKTPIWGAPLVNEYLTERKKEDKQHTTIAFDRAAINKFLNYLNSLGFDKWNDITPQLIIDFQIQDNHSSVESKNAYSTKIRAFIGFLARKNLVENTLVLAFHPKVADTTHIVEVLNQNQKNVIYNYIHNSTTSMDFRTSAMITLGLHLGLRSVDVVNLKFSNINWEKKTISIIQQKTQEPLITPFSPIVGEMLCRYITLGRPIQAKNCPYIFIRSKAPYTKVTNPSVTSIINKILVTANLSPIKGFHTFRKDFATTLLNNNIDFQDITSALGQKTSDSLNPYLSLDHDKMKKCTLSLKGINFIGGYNNE